MQYINFVLTHSNAIDDTSVVWCTNETHDLHDIRSNILVRCLTSMCSFFPIFLYEKSTFINN